MSVLTDPEEDQRPGAAEGGVPSQPDGANHDSPLDQQGASPLTASETSRFDQITAGLQAVGAHVGNNKKKYLLGGGGIGIVAFMIMGFFALLPLKLEAVVKADIEKRVTNKVDYMMEKRADKMVVKYLGERFIGNGATYTGPGLLGTMYGNWAKNNFEAKFTEKSGITIEKADGGGIKLTAADGIKSTYPNAEEFEKFLGTNKGLNARNFLRQVTRNETKWYQVVKRRNLRRFMRNAYGIHKWSWFTGKDGKDAETEVITEEVTAQQDVLEERVPEIIDCGVDETPECETSTRDNPESNPNPDTPAGPTDGSNVKEQSKSAIGDMVDKAKQYTPSELAKKGLSKVLAPILGEALSESIASKAIPGVGQVLLVDQLARLNDFLKSGKADAVIRNMHKTEYATTFAAFSSMSDNWKDPNKKMSGDEFNAVMNQLGDISKSCDSNGQNCQTVAAFNDLFLNKDGGKNLASNVSISDTATPIKDSMAAAELTPPLLALQTWHTIVDETYLSQMINAINAGIGGAINLLWTAMKIVAPPVAGLFNTITGAMADVAKAVVLKIAVPAVDGTETGGDLLMAIDAGGAVTGQDFARSLGGHPLTTQQSADLQQAIAANLSQQAPGLMTRLFSKDYTSSVVNQLAIAMPATVSGAASTAGSTTMAVITSPWHFFGGLFGSIIPGAHADTTRNLYGLTDYGFTDAELNQPIAEDALNQAVQNAATRLGQSPDQVAQHPGLVEPSDCPDPDPNGPNLCRLDLATIQSMNSVFTADDDGGLD